MSISLLACIDQKLNSMINRKVQLGESFQELNALYPESISATYEVQGLRYSSANSGSQRTTVDFYYKADFSECVIATKHNGQYSMRRCVSGNIQGFITAFQQRNPAYGRDVCYNDKTDTYTYTSNSITYFICFK